jgi:hypothetical protein
MLSRLARARVRTGLFLLVLVVALFGLGVAAYAMQVRGSARALVGSARGIHTTADAEREIASWRKRVGVLSRLRAPISVAPPDPQ